MGKNHLTHFDFVVTDTGQSVDFYQQVFDWNFMMENEFGYRSVDTYTYPVIGIMPNVTPKAMPCFKVDNIQNILIKVVLKGGCVVQNMQDHPMGNGVIYAIVEDLDGIQIAVIQYPTEEES